MPDRPWVWYPHPSHLAVHAEGKSHFCLFLPITLINAQRTGQWKIWAVIPALEKTPVWACDSPWTPQPDVCWISHWPIHPTLPGTRTKGNKRKGGVGVWKTQGLTQVCSLLAVGPFGKWRTPRAAPCSRKYSRCDYRPTQVCSCT